MRMKIIKSRRTNEPQRLFNEENNCRWSLFEAVIEWRSIDGGGWRSKLRHATPALGWREENKNVSCEIASLRIKVPLLSHGSKPYLSHHSAQKLFLLNLNAMVHAMYYGLLAIAPVESLTQVLIFTKQSSTPALAYRRFKANAAHSTIWYKYPIKPGTR